MESQAAVTQPLCPGLEAHFEGGGHTALAITHLSPSWGPRESSCLLTGSHKTNFHRVSQALRVSRVPPAEWLEMRLAALTKGLWVAPGKKEEY